MRRALAAAAIVLCAAGSAAAHPHVWIDADAGFVMEGGRLAAIDIGWTFDPAVSAAVLADWDFDGSGHLEEAEQAALAEAIFPGLGEYGYFTHLRLGGAVVPLENADRFVPTADAASASYRFRLHLAQPVDPAAVPVVVGLYDETFYVSIEYKPEAITISGEGAERCHTEIADDPDNPIYFGLVIPQKITLVCTPA